LNTVRIAISEVRNSTCPMPVILLLIKLVPYIIRNYPVRKAPLSFRLMPESQGRSVFLKTNTYSVHPISVSCESKQDRQVQAEPLLPARG
jgi:hypothetical protein